MKDRSVATSPCLLALIPVTACATNGSVGSPAPAVAPTQAFRDCPDCPSMVALPAGDLWIGPPPDESGRAGPGDIEEGPRRHLAIAAFAVGRFAITRGEWATFVAATGRPVRGGCSWSALPGSQINGSNAAASWKNLGFERADDHPAVCIGWFDAQDYVRWLSARTGHRYRLPSEAEWEYAARAGTSTPYPWGTEPRRDRANYGTDACCGGFVGEGDRWMYTSPVSAFPPNAFGLYDMHGNAMQWVADCLSASYADRPATGAAYEKNLPLKLGGELADLNGEPSCAYRVIRGGNWGDTPALIRSAARNVGSPPGESLWEYSSAGGGFRVARSLD